MKSMKILADTDNIRIRSYFSMDNNFHAYDKIDIQFEFHRLHPYLYFLIDLCSLHLVNITNSDKFLEDI